jgi:2-keto-3-deoxy-6-phosphogluconate aldolase
MIGAISRALGDHVLVGAGSVLDAATAQAALDIGRGSWSARTSTRTW